MNLKCVKKQTFKSALIRIITYTKQLKENIAIDEYRFISVLLRILLVSRSTMPKKGFGFNIRGLFEGKEHVL